MIACVALIMVTLLMCKPQVKMGERIDNILKYDQYALFYQKIVTYRSGAIVISPLDSSFCDTWVYPPFFCFGNYRVRPKMDYYPDTLPLLQREAALKLAKEFESLHLSYLEVKEDGSVHVIFYDSEGAKITMDRRSGTANASQFHPNIIDDVWSLERLVIIK